MKMLDEILIRDGLVIDLPFIKATWLNHYRTNSYFARKIKKSIYFDGHNRVVDRLMAKPSTLVKIAHYKEEVEVVLGFLVYEWLGQDPCIHYLFVVEELREAGIAKKLLRENQLDQGRFHFSHWTFLVTDLIKKWPDAFYDPYQAFLE